MNHEELPPRDAEFALQSASSVPEVQQAYILFEERQITAEEGRWRDGFDTYGVQGTGPFLRGDCDGNGVFGGSPTKAIVLLNFSFRGRPAPPCLAACDAEANGSIGITDALPILRAAMARANKHPKTARPDDGTR